MSLLLLGTLLCGIFATRPLYGQVTAEIVGTVEDLQHAVIPGAQVTVTSLATAIPYKTKTNAAGAYTVPFLQPGSYRVDVAAPGFRPVSRTGIVLEVAQTATVNLVLEVGANVQTVTVTDTTPLLDVSTSAIGGLVKPEQVENLPMLGRNSNALMVLEPGVVATSATTSQPVEQSHYQFFSINGSRPDQSQFLLDGGNDTNLAFNGPEYTPQVEEVQEYRIQTSNFSAVYGNSAGGVINISTKAGTNKFHGSLFEYVQNNIFSANNFFSNRSGSPVPKLRQNQFGGTVGGPIKRERAFFFFAYEGLRQITPDIVTSSVPTDLQRTGDFSQTFTSTGQLVKIYDAETTAPNPNSPGQYTRTQFPNNKIPQSRLDPVAMAMAKYYPEPNQQGNPETGLNNYFLNASNIAQVNNYSGRGDYHLSDNTQLMGRFSDEVLNPWINPGNFGHDIISYNYATKPQHHLYALGKVIHTFSPTFFGEFHGSWARWFYSQSGLSNGFDPTTLGFPSYVAANAISLGFPQITFTEMADIGGVW